MYKFSDKCGFHLSKFVNIQNIRTWARDIPGEIPKDELHSEEAAWCAVHANSVVGPQFFKNGAVKRVMYYPVLDAQERTEAQQGV